MPVNIIKKQNDGKILVGGGYNGTYQSVSLNNICRLDISGSLDISFNMENGTNSNVFAIDVQSDGKIILGGSFTSYSGSSVNRIVRVNESGSIDDTFNTGEGFNGPVRSIAVQNDGKILVGGDISAYSGSFELNGFVRLNSDGTIDDTMNLSGFNNSVYKILIQPDNKIICVGNFNSYGDTTAFHIARLNSDGTIDSTFNHGPYINSTVYSVALQEDGKILVGGQFIQYSSGSNYTTNRILRLDSSGSLDTSFYTGNGFNQAVLDVKVQNKEILVGGEFTEYNGTYSNQFIKLTDSGSVFEGFEGRFVAPVAVPA